MAMPLYVIAEATAINSVGLYTSLRSGHLRLSPTDRVMETLAVCESG